MRAGAGPEVFHLPGVDTADPEVCSGWYAGATASGLRFRSPVLTPSGAARVAERVGDAAADAREARSLDQVVKALAEAARRLVDPASPVSEQACRIVGEELGWPSEVARETLSEMGKLWTEKALQSVLHAELSDPAMLDEFRPAGAGRRRRAAGPRLLLQVVAGNVPGVAVTGVIRGLLCRSGVLVKLPEDEPGLVVLFISLLAEVDRALAEAVAATWWPSGRESALWDEWTARATKIVVYGGEEAVSGVRARARADQDVVAYGPKLGIGVVLPGADLSAAASALARDICAYDQAGCVSPRLVFTLESAGEFGEQLATALSEEVSRIPRPTLRTDEAIAIRSLRAEVEFRGIGGRGGRLIGSTEDLSWTVLVDDPPVLELDPLPRVVRLSAVESVSALWELLLPLAGRIQALGYAGDGGQLPSLAAAAASLRVSRIAPLGSMAWPPVDWRHDGRPQLLPLLEWTDWEE